MEKDNFYKSTNSNYMFETFVPLYITNYCDSKCAICNMRVQNKNFIRIEGPQDEILEQIKIIYEVEGISSICFLSGEYIPGKKRYDNLHRIIWCINAAIKIGYEKIYFNIGSLYDEEIKELKENILDKSKIVLSLFQETYNEECYKSFFGVKSSDNPKSNYDLRVSTPERWINAGFQQVDIGILLGLTNPSNDIDELITHAKKLKAMNATVHISLPRIRGIKSVPYNISDDEFRSIIQNIATKCPWAHLIITTRESVEMINSLLKYIKIISPGCSDVLPYSKEGKIYNNELTSQFQVSPIRERPSTVLNNLDVKPCSINYYTSNIDRL